ncbi:MAG: N-acetyltransferase [Betaproteobacteria bacterium]|nr:N-acetyltransferase [Betaproteobacteria bacterium]
MTKAFSWRTATRVDLPRIVEIYNRTIPTRMVTADLEPVSVESREAWFALHVPGFRPLWVSELNGHVAAWLSFSSFYGRPAYDGTAEVSLYVDYPHQRGGLGSYLLTEAMRESPALQIRTLLAFVFGHNAPSLKLFQRHGFETWGTLPGVAVLDAEERDLVILGCRPAGQAGS